MTSPRQSPIRDPDKPTTPTPEKTSPKPQTPAREDDPAGSPPRSPLCSAEHPTPPPTNGAVEEPPPPSLAIVIANRMFGEEAPAAEKVVDSAGLRLRDRGLGTVQTASTRSPRAEQAALWLRVAALVLCMIAFSVMASDKTEGWAGDSFDRYKEFRYLVAVNVIAFVYSAFQVYVRIHRRMTTKYLYSRRMRFSFDFVMDQTLAYLLMSATSAAASRNDVWISRFGRDEFTRKANGSIAVSFLAFLVLSLSSVISAYNFFRWSS